MRSGPDVVILSEEDVVTVLHTAETANKRTNKEETAGRQATECVLGETYYSAK